MLAPVFSLLLLYYYHVSTTGLIAFDCSDDSTEVTEISLIDTQHCKMEEDNITSQLKTIQVLQPRVYQSVEYMSCLIEIDHFIFRCGKTIDTIHTKFATTEVPKITRDQCKTLLTNGVYDYLGYRILIDTNLNEHVVSLETHGQIEGGSCTPGTTLIVDGTTLDRPVRTSKFKISINSNKATLDTENKKLSFVDGTLCDYNKFTCFSANIGFVYWENAFKEQSCNDGKYMVIYQGPASIVSEYNTEEKNKMVVIKYQNYNFQIMLTKEKQEICGKVVLLTEHPKLSISIREEGEEFKFQKGKDDLGKNVNLMTYINSKLLFTTRHVKEQVTELYRKLSFARCQANSKITHNMMTLATISPHQFAFEYFGTSGYTAAVRGEVIYITRCNPVSVNFTAVRTTDCYMEIPVLYKTENYFISPRSRILQTMGTKVECSNILPIKYKINDKWFIITSTSIIPTTEPERIIVSDEIDWKFKDIKNYIDMGIYSPDDLDKIQKVMLESNQHEAITSQIIKGVKYGTRMDEGLTGMGLINVNEIRVIADNAVTTFMNKFLWFFGGFGTWIAAIIGFISLLKCIKFLLNIVFNTLELYSIFGSTWRLCFVWWENLVHIMIRKHQQANNPTVTGKDKKKNVKNETTEELLEFVTVSNFPN